MTLASRSSTTRPKDQLFTTPIFTRTKYCLGVKREYAVRGGFGASALFAYGGFNRRDRRNCLVSALHPSEALVNIGRDLYFDRVTNRLYDSFGLGFDTVTAALIGPLSRPTATSADPCRTPLGGRTTDPTSGKLLYVNYGAANGRERRHRRLGAPEVLKGEVHAANGNTRKYWLGRSGGMMPERCGRSHAFDSPRESEYMGEAYTPNAATRSRGRCASEAGQRSIAVRTARPVENSHGLS